MRVGHYEELPLVVNIGRFGRISGGSTASLLPLCIAFHCKQVYTQARLFNNNIYNLGTWLSPSEYRLPRRNERSKRNFQFRLLSKGPLESNLFSSSKSVVAQILSRTILKFHPVSSINIINLKKMNSSDFFEAMTSTSAPPVVPTNHTCDCSGSPDSTPGELTIVALSAVSVLKSTTSGPKLRGHRICLLVSLYKKYWWD